MVNLNGYALYCLPQPWGMILKWWLPTVRLASIRGLSPADRRVVNDTGYNLLTRAYHLVLPLLREMWFIICSHIHTLDIHSTLKFSCNSNLLTRAYHLVLPLLREMWFIICSHIHTLNIHSTLKFSCNSTYYQYHYREVSSSLHYSTGQIKKSMQKGSLDQSLKF